MSWSHLDIESKKKSLDIEIQNKKVSLRLTDIKTWSRYRPHKSCLLSPYTLYQDCEEQGAHARNNLFLVTQSILALSHNTSLVSKHQQHQDILPGTQVQK